MTICYGRRVSLDPQRRKSKAALNSQLSTGEEEERKEGRKEKLFEVKWQCRGKRPLSDTDASIRVREGRGLYYRSSWTKKPTSLLNCGSLRSTATTG